MYCKEGQTLAKMLSFTQHLHEYFCIFSQTAKQSKCSHMVSSICDKIPRNSIYTKGAKEQA